MIELGTGLDAFEPLLPDQALEVERGPQGGFHFIVRPRVRDIDGGTNGSTLTRFQAFRDGMEKIDIFQCPHNFEYDEVDASGFLVMSSVFLIIDDRLAATLDGSHVLLRTEVADERGRYAIDERWVFAALPQQPE